MKAKGPSLPRRDLILILAILSVAGIWYGITRYQALKGPSEVAQVTVDGKLVETNVKNYQITQVVLED